MMDLQPILGATSYTAPAEVGKTPPSTFSYPAALVCEFFGYVSVWHDRPYEEEWERNAELPIFVGFLCTGTLIVPLIMHSEGGWSAYLTDYEGVISEF